MNAVGKNAEEFTLSVRVQVFVLVIYYVSSTKVFLLCYLYSWTIFFPCMLAWLCQK